MGKNYTNQAGKGDRFRPVDKLKYNDNYDNIDWKKKDEKKKDK
jgi:hypothetical protein